MRARWRSALVVVAVVAAGCGNGAVGDGGGGAPPKLPVGNASGGQGSAASMKAEVATHAAIGAPAMAPIRAVEYRLAADAKAPATTATAYQLRLSKDDVTARVAK